MRLYASIYEFRPFAEEVTALRLGARRRSTGLYACVLQGVRTLVPEEGVAYIEFAGHLLPSITKGLRYIKRGMLLVTPAIKIHNDH